MKNNDKFYITLEGKVNIPKQEITSDVLAKVMRLLFPLSSEPNTPEEIRDSSTATSAPISANGYTAKQFMSDKQPKSDMERITCLAYYLTNYKKVTSFKTSDLTHLNAEAAQPRFSNASVAVDNATAQQYLARSGNGKKVITTRGDALVEALPDRVKLKEALDKHQIYGNKHKNTKKKKLK